MKKWLTLMVLLLVVGCDLFPMDPVDDKPKGSAKKAAACALADDMMHHPAKYDPDFPSDVVVRGRALWNAWKCGEDGKVES